MFLTNFHSAKRSCGTDIGLIAGNQTLLAPEPNPMSEGAREYVRCKEGYLWSNDEAGTVMKSKTCRYDGTWTAVAGNLYCKAARKFRFNLNLISRTQEFCDFFFRDFQ